MLRESADQLHRTLLRSFPASRDYPADAFASAPMPAPLAFFLQRTLETRLANVGDLAQSPWYDVDAPVVRATREAWRTALFSTARVPASAWSKTLEHAVRLVLAYLIRPAQTLTAFIYGSEDRHVEASAVLHRLSYFSEYGYLQAGAHEYISKEHLGHVNRTPFLNLITRLDRAYTAGYGADDWMRHLTPLFETLRPIAGAGVPTELLRIFFEHKAVTEITQRLQAEEVQRGIAVLDEAGLYRVMTRRGASSQSSAPPSVDPSKSTGPGERPLPGANRAPESSSRGEDRPRVSAGGTDKVEDESTPLWMRFRRPASEPAREARPSDASPPPVRPDRVPGPLEDAAEIEELSLAVPEPDFAFQAFEVGEDDLHAADELLGEEEAEPGARPVESRKPGMPVSDRREPGQPGARRLADVVADALRAVPPPEGQGSPASSPSSPSGPPPAHGEEEGDRAVPLWMRFRKPSDTPLGETLTASRESARSPDLPRGSRAEDLGSRVLGDSVQRMPAGQKPTGQDPVYRPLEVIERALFGPSDPERRRWFVQQLFGDSEENYTEVLRAIHSSESWPEASRVIARDVFRRHNVNIYSEPAVAFTDAVEAYFRQSQ